MTHTRKAIDATIESVEDLISKGQYNVRANAEMLLALHQLKEFYPQPKKETKNETRVRSKAQHTKNV